MVLERSQFGDVVPVRAITWKKMYMASWNDWGMCFSSNPGTLSGPRAYCMVRHAV